MKIGNKKMPPSGLLLWPGWLLMLGLSGCYSFHSGRLPFKTMGVPVAANATGDYRLPDLVTKAVLAAITRDGSVTQAEPENSEGVMAIEIKSYSRDPLKYSAQEVVSEYKITITAAVTVKNDQGKVLWENLALVAWSTYLPDQEEEIVGIGKASDKLAEEIIRQAFETW
ncbi:MAG: LptE family protein [Deltaproteobacteria bacterium]|nr:LptE family protein [Deltaproteobacteria bacterium]